MAQSQFMGSELAHDEVLYKPHFDEDLEAAMTVPVKALAELNASARFRHNFDAETSKHPLPHRECHHSVGSTP
jgi:hypothetical protein